MGKVIERGKKRRAKQRKNEKAKQQSYGGSEAKSRELAKRNERSIDYAEGLAYDGTKAAYAERDKYQNAVDAGYKDIRHEMEDQYKRADATLGQNETERLKQLGNEQTYGAGSDQSLSNYNAGRGAILGGATALEQAGGRSAGMLEGYAQNAASEYQSAADKAFNASTERAQRQALGVAAGRGANSIRTALAGANAANQQANLDQQVVRAQEANQLNAMRNDAVAQAAGIRAQGIGGAAQIRSGLGDQDQAAAQIQAQRQQAAGGMAADALKTRAGIEQTTADYQMGGLGAQQALEKSNTDVGMQAAGLESQVGGGMAGQFLGAEQAQQGAQLGANVQTELQRAEAAKANDALKKTSQWTKAFTLGILG
jgi:hypothetical protein